MNLAQGGERVDRCWRTACAKAASKDASGNGSSYPLATWQRTVVSPRSRAWALARSTWLGSMSTAVTDPERRSRRARR